MDFGLEYWDMKARFLFERGVHWQSPARLNTNILFD